ncbi:hypothetical protein B0H16DRAFT_1685191 [Mycena metata]|uniref:PWWP domain-containing protein n=1 Tax=Mycena metata TaxID=1033252 RepID=A0AAD7JWL8_9AGAR|nr:hypothetical protein B0H16DRAFT_1685191 [Mycena metata]
MSGNRASTSRISTAMKRDSFAAELERDPNSSPAKRQAFTSNMAHASLERQLVAAQTTKLELETKLREKDTQIEKLKRDRQWFSDREQEEREEKEREQAEHQQETQKKDSELRTLRSSLADLQGAHSNLQRSTSQTIASQKSQITALRRQTSLLEEEVSQFKRLAEERSQTIDGVMKALVGSFSLEESNKEGAPTATDGARLEQVQQPVSIAEQRKQELEAERSSRLETQPALAELDAQPEKIEELEPELFELGGEIAGARHVPPSTSVLTSRDTTPDVVLRDNPEARQIERGHLKRDTPHSTRSAAASASASAPVSAPPAAASSSTPSRDPIRDLGRLSGQKRVEPGTLVWAKAVSFPWWPAIVFHDRNEYIPARVLHETLQERKKKKSKKDWYIVRFFDKTKSWCHIPIDKMRTLGEIKELDQDMLSKNSQMQKESDWGRHKTLFAECQHAYEEAIDDMESGDEKEAFLQGMKGG